MEIVAVGVSHRSAPLEILERFTFAPGSITGALLELCQLEGIKEAVLLTTCHRTEVYVATPDVSTGVSSIMRFLGGSRDVPLEVLEEYLFQLQDLDAAKHLFTVASGLDSMVVGEGQVLGQVRDALKQASAVGTARAYLSALFRQAIRVGARVRKETRIGGHGRSISSVAVELARKLFGDLRGRVILVIGTGAASELVLQALRRHGTGRILVVSRTPERASVVAQRYGGQAITYQDLPDALKEVDIVISSTAAPHPVISLELMEEAAKCRTHPLLLIDIAVPRDIDPRVRTLPNVYLYDLEGLQEIVNERIRENMEEVPRAERIIAEEVEKFARWLRTRQVAPTIAELYARAEMIRAAEVRKAIRRLGHLTEREREIVEAMTSALVKKLLHLPVVSLKRKVAYGETASLEAVREMFGLDGAAESRLQTLDLRSQARDLGDQDPRTRSGFQEVNPHA
ncbi:MAG: glutamyl-tRNA reductase [Armatimonadota bacterium]|nr:glutamyl-tRNA reductase [Armatimonadota bacterium]